jgi:hypothetical protein
MVETNFKVHLKVQTLAPRGFLSKQNSRTAQGITATGKKV